MRHFSDYHGWEVLPHALGEGNSTVIFHRPLLKSIITTEDISYP